MLETFEIRDNGEIKISDDVIAVIATVAALNVDGVGKMSGTIAEDFSHKLGIKGQDGKGVKVEFVDGALNLSLYIFVEYGYNVVDIASKVQEAVKDSVVMMTDMQIKNINIYVQGITLDRENKFANLMTGK